MIRNCSKFKFYLMCELFVFSLTNFSSRRRNINQTTKNTRLCFRDLHRTVCTDKQKRMKTLCISAFKLFIYGHLFMRNNRIQSSIVLNSRKVAVVLNSDKRIRFKRLESEAIRIHAQRFGIEYRIISIKQILNNVQDSRLTSSRRTIKDQKFLYPNRLSCDDGSNRPFEFMTFFWIIQSRYQFLICFDRAFFQRILDCFADIILFLDLFSRKH